MTFEQWWKQDNIDEDSMCYMASKRAWEAGISEARKIIEKQIIGLCDRTEINEFCTKLLNNIDECLYNRNKNERRRSKENI